MLQDKAEKFAGRENFWRNKSVFVTGVTGFLGSWLAIELVRRGARVIGLVRDQIPDSYFYLSGIAKRVSQVQGSLEDLGLLRRAISEYDVEYCFHLAAQTIVGVANQNPIPTFQSNIQGTWSILEAVRLSSGIRGVILASSDKAYGTQRVPYEEEAPLKAEHPYDVSKACGELIAQAYFKTYRLPVVITRCTNLYGGGDLNFSRVIPGTIRSILCDEPPIVRSDGTPVRDYLYVTDAVQGYLALGEHLHEKGVVGEAFNFGAGQPSSVIEIVNKLIEASGKTQLKPVIQGKGKLQGEIDQQFLTTEKAEQLLDWTPTARLNEGLLETYRWYHNFLESRDSLAIELHE